MSLFFIEQLASPHNTCQMTFATIVEVCTLDTQTEKPRLRHK